jgi:hypothetical protein
MVGDRLLLPVLMGKGIDCCDGAYCVAAIGASGQRVSSGGCGVVVGGIIAVASVGWQANVGAGGQRA